MIEIDTTNDEVRVYKTVNDEYGWRRVDLGNGRVVSRSSGNDTGGYLDYDYAMAAAEAYNPGVPILDRTGKHADATGDEVEQP